MFYRLRNYLAKNKFNINCRDILHTQPLTPRKEEPVIVSMLGHLELIMYILAIKSFYKRLGQGRIIVLNDGTLTSKDKAILKYHVSPSDIIDIKHFKPDRHYYYIAWRTFLFIADLVKENYVIQLDTDTLTSGPITEVISCVKENKNFILGSWESQEIELVEVICERVKNKISGHVQIQAEKKFDKLSDYKNRKYIRGCSALFGSSKGSYSRPEVERFADEMEKLIGPLWHNWGSEQVAVNYIIANSPNMMVLPYPKYASFYAGGAAKTEKNAFLHFIGSHRFRKGFYLKSAKEIIRELLC